MENQSGELKKLSETLRKGSLMYQLIKEVEEYEENGETDYKELTDEEKIEEEKFLKKMKKLLI